MLQDSAERLGQDVIQYEESPGSIVEAAKNIASMWKKMAQLIRSGLSIILIKFFIKIDIKFSLSRKECVLKERMCKDDIVEVAKNITKESQEVTRIATVAARACTDSRMRMVGGANDIVDWAFQHNNYASAAGKGCQYQLKYCLLNK